MASKKVEDAATEVVKDLGKAVVDTMRSVGSDRITDTTGPLSQLKALSAEYQQVNIYIKKIDEKLNRKSLFTELGGMPMSEALAIDPESLCKREGGGGVWEIQYRTPDNRGKPVVITGIRTEGRPHVIATHESISQGVDKFTGVPTGAGGLPLHNATPIPGFGGGGTDLIKTIQQATESTAARERQHTADIFNATKSTNEMLMAVLLGGQQKQTTEAPHHNEELRMMREQNQRMMEEMRSLREEQRKSESDRQMAGLQQQLAALQDKLVETQKSSELRMLEAKLAEVSKPTPIDPTINLLTTVLGATREDAKSNNALMLELFGKLSDKPDTTDKFAKVQNLLLESAMGQFQLMQQIAQAQGGSSSPMVEIFRTIAQTASAYFGGQAEGEEEEELEETPVVRQIAGVSERQLTAAPDPEPEPEVVEVPQPQEGEPMKIDAKQLHQEIKSQVERWDAGEPIPEQDDEGNTILLSEKELNKVLATSSLDTAIRVLVSGKKPIPEVTARIYALVEGDHPLAIHWLTHPLPASWQILKRWDQANGKNLAQQKIVDLTIDMILHWAWVNDGNDPYGRSTYRPSKAAVGVEERTHGVTSQGKPMQSQFGTKQGEEVTEEGEGS